VLNVYAVTFLYILKEYRDSVDDILRAIRASKVKPLNSYMIDEMTVIASFFFLTILAVKVNPHSCAAMCTNSLFFCYGHVHGINSRERGSHSW